jgi:hypothetical protein
MSQIGKTSIFVVVAVAVVLAVFFTRPKSVQESAENVVGDKLIADFDPLAAADMEIVDYDEATGLPKVFEVKRTEQKGKQVWTILSRYDYPADAKDQVAQAATSLSGLVILGTKGDSQDEQEEYGVVDYKTVKDGGRGVGMKVTLRDKNGKDLVSLIVGKEVPKQKSQRYVRVAGQNAIYIVEMKTENLTTRFDRWIEKSLLQISPWDLSKLWIRDHALEEASPGRYQLAQHGEIVLQYNDQGKPQWELLENLALGQNDKLESVKVPDDQELNLAKLDEMKNALPELKIVDVRRKPEGFSADLKAKGDVSDLAKHKDILEKYGFLWADAGEGVDLYSNNGEIRCLMNTGVEYILRFGDYAPDFDANNAKDEKETEKKSGVNRFLFVMAQFNPAGIPQLQLAPLPGDQPAPSETKPAGENAAPPSDEKKPVEAKPASYAQQAPADEKPVDAKPADAAPTDGKPAEGTPPAVKPGEENSIELPTDPKMLEAAREKVEKENQRKKDEYEKKIADGKKRVEELNARFADWFYIIPDETYQKIHLTRDNLLVKKGEKKPEKPEGGELPPGLGMPPGMPGGM